MKAESGRTRDVPARPVRLPVRLHWRLHWRLSRASAALRTTVGATWGAVLRATLGGLLGRPMVRRLTAVGGLAVAGWLLGSGVSAWADQTPTPVDGAPVISVAGSAAPHIREHAQTPHVPASHVPAAQAPSLRRTVRDVVAVHGRPVRHPVSGAVRRIAGSTRDTARQTVQRPAAHPTRRSGAVRAVRDVLDRDIDLSTAGARRPRGGSDPARLDTSRLGRYLSPVLRGDAARPSAQAEAARHAVTSVVPRSPDATSHGEPSPQATTTTDAVSGGPAGGTAAVGRTIGTRAAEHASADRVPTRAAWRADRPAPPGVAGSVAPATAIDRVLCGGGQHDCVAHRPPTDPAAPGGPGGQAPGGHGMVPSPATGGPQPVAGQSDVARFGAAREPQRLVIRMPRRGVLPPAVRTAADEPSLSPD